MPTLTITKGREVEIKLRVVNHPSTHSKDLNCYYFEVVLAIWGRSNAYVHSSKKTSWMVPGGEKLSFTFRFDKPAHASEYLIKLYVSLGIDKKDAGGLPMQAAVIYQTGSFTKRGQALLEEKIKNRAHRFHYLARGIGRKPVEPDEDRVMPDS